MIQHPARYAAGRICCTLGILWAAAGALKEIFGIRISLPFLPPLDLQRVSEGRAMFIGVCLYVAGSWLVRLGDPSRRAPAIEDDPGVTPSELASGFPLENLPMSRRSEDRV